MHQPERDLKPPPLPAGQRLHEPLVKPAEVELLHELRGPPLGLLAADPVGLAFVEQDIVSQLIDERQWQHAFGIAYNAESEPQGGSFPYAAFKQMRPNDEPAFGVEEMYYSMYMLALGIHLAGPNLTPESFEAGMFSYPGRSGPRGFWSFSSTDYTPVDDYREIWWDPKRISPQNNKPGAWVQINRGARYTPATQPNSPPSTSSTIRWCATGSTSSDWQVSAQK